MNHIASFLLSIKHWFLFIFQHRQLQNDKRGKFGPKMFIFLRHAPVDVGHVILSNTWCSDSSLKLCNVSLDKFAFFFHLSHSDLSQKISFLTKTPKTGYSVWCLWSYGLNIKNTNEEKKNYLDFVASSSKYLSLLFLSGVSVGAEFTSIAMQWFLCHLRSIIKHFNELKWFFF